MLTELWQPLKRLLGLETKLVQKRFAELVWFLLFTAVLIYCIGTYIDANNPDKLWRFTAPILSVAVFSLVAYKLWTYRIIDREAQDNFAHYAQGIQLVTSNSSLRKIMGINLLDRVSKRTPAYNEEIKYVLIENLKRSRTLPDGCVQPIIRWLYQHYHKKHIDFYGHFVTLYIEGQTLNLADDSCRRGLVWLLLQADDGKVTIDLLGSQVNYKMLSRNISVHDRAARLESLIDPIKSEVRNLDPSNKGVISDLEELVELLEKEAVEIRESLHEIYKQPAV